MGIIDHQPRAFGPGLASQCGKVGQITVHAEHAISYHQRIAVGLLQPRGQTEYVVMQITIKTRTAQQACIQQRSMIETVFKHRIALPRQSGNCAQIGHIAIAEQQRPRATGELG